jgi:hypothetical protein
MYYQRARYYRPDAGRFWSMDSYEGSPVRPITQNKYLYCHANPIGSIDPTGFAAYYVERAFNDPSKEKLWSSGMGHGYLLFTSHTDPAVDDPFTSKQEILATFSWHPSTWIYGGSQTAGRVWESDIIDRSPGSMHRTYLVTKEPAQQTILTDFIESWIHTAPVGYEKGEPMRDPGGNTIGSEESIPAPMGGVYYSLQGQNCVWWATIMLKQSGVEVPWYVYAAAGSFNSGQGFASQVVAKNRDAFEVGTMNATRFRMPVTIDLSPFGLMQ